MNVEAKPYSVWASQPRRRGWTWLWRNTLVFLRLARNAALCRFISLVGALTVPGARPAGRLQALALRAMGVHCPSRDVWIGRNFHVDFPERLRLGRRIAIGADTHITARDTVTIGDDFLAAPGLCLNTGSHDPITLVPHSSPIAIGAGVWCGLRVTICCGVSVGAGCIIGAGSVVVRDLPGHQVARGVPCQPQRDIASLRRGQKLWSNFRRVGDAPEP